jgi:hypothetical protein
MLSSLIHVRMKVPDKREVGSSTLPRPMKLELIIPHWLTLMRDSCVGDKRVSSRCQLAFDCGTLPTLFLPAGDARWISKSGCLIGNDVRTIVP